MEVKIYGIWQIEGNASHEKAPQSDHKQNWFSDARQEKSTKKLFKLLQNPFQVNFQRFVSKH